MLEAKDFTVGYNTFVLKVIISSPYGDPKMCVNYREETEED